MSLIKTNAEQQSIIEQVIVMGDLARLTPDQRNIYYKSVCDSIGVNPLTRPFEYITLNGKLTLYARKDCTDQLRKINGVSIRIIERAVMDDLMVVTAEATDKTGRIDSSIGAVSIASLRGEAKANALMKAETKARRRVTLSLCGLGLLDESEIESIPNARIGEPDQRPSVGAASMLLATDLPKQREEPTRIETPDATQAKIEIDGIEEHKANGSPVWKVTTKDARVFACFDQMIVSDLSDAHADDLPVTVETVRKGKNTVIVSIKGGE